MIMKPLFSKLALFSLIMVIVLVSSGFSGKESQKGHKPDKHKSVKVALLIPGPSNDGGFMESALNGLLKAQNELKVKTSYVDNINPDIESIATALRKLAKKKPDLIIAHAGQSTEAIKIVAKEFPKIRFVNTQGNAVGNNLSSYQVLQEESAWLAGAAAGLLTKTNIVGHISGARVTPGFNGRAAFADGLKYTNPNATYLTTFTGNQDDAVLSKKVAQAEINAGADIIFTMLNKARIGVTEANRESGTFQIGNVRDYYADAPDVFIGSAISDAGQTVYKAIKDLTEKKWAAGVVVQIGASNPDAVRLTLAPHVSKEIVDQIAELSKKIISGEIEISLKYEGPDFVVSP
ncbi:Purine-binding protein precursor [compost metagenome]